MMIITVSCSPVDALCGVPASCRVFWGRWWLAHCASWSVPICFSALLEKSVLLIGWDPVHMLKWCHLKLIHGLSEHTSIWLFGDRSLFHSVFRPWPSSTPLWSRTTHPDGVHVRSQRSLKTCPTSLSAKATVWERYCINLCSERAKPSTLFLPLFSLHCVLPLSGCWLDWSDLSRQEIHKWVRQLSTQMGLHLKMLLSIFFFTSNLHVVIR